jgi:transcriptional regulator with XRE-family HTH domain
MSNKVHELSDFFINSRREACLTQKQLSDLSGVSVRTISRIENGENPNLPTLRELLKVIFLILKEKNIVSTSFEDINIIFFDANK